MLILQLHISVHDDLHAASAHSSVRLDHCHLDSSF